MHATTSPAPLVHDPEVDPALEAADYVEPPELKARLDIEESQGE